MKIPEHTNHEARRQKLFQHMEAEGIDYKKEPIAAEFCRHLVAAESDIDDYKRAKIDPRKPSQEVIEMCAEQYTQDAIAAYQKMWELIDAGELEVNIKLKNGPGVFNINKRCLSRYEVDLTAEPLSV